MCFDDQIIGPAIIIDKNRLNYYSNVLTNQFWFLNHFIYSTLLIEPKCVAFLKENGDIEVEVEHFDSSYQSDDDATRLDTTQLSVFGKRLKKLPLIIKICNKLIIIYAIQFKGIVS